MPELLQTVHEIDAELLRRTVDDLDPCADVARHIACGLVDEPPASLRDGGVIRDGFDPELDELRSIRRDGRSFISSLETKEREATGIGSLKVRFNKVFGYFIEVTKSNLHLVPDHYRRKQTIANGERYITPELKEYEAKVLQAQEGYTQRPSYCRPMYGSVSIVVRARASEALPTQWVRPVRDGLPSRSSPRTRRCTS